MRRQWWGRVLCGAVSALGACGESGQQSSAPQAPAHAVGSPDAPVPGRDLRRIECAQYAQVLCRGEQSEQGAGEDEGQAQHMRRRGLSDLRMQEALDQEAKAHQRQASALPRQQGALGGE